MLTGKPFSTGTSATLLLLSRLKAAQSPKTGLGDSRTPPDAASERCPGPGLMARRAPLGFFESPTRQLACARATLTQSRSSVLRLELRHGLVSVVSGAATSRKSGGRQPGDHQAAQPDFPMAVNTARPHRANGANGAEYEPSRHLVFRTFVVGRVLWCRVSGVHPRVWGAAPGFRS